MTDGYEIDRRSGPGKIPPDVIERVVANAENLKTEAQILRNEISMSRTARKTGLVLALVVILFVIGTAALGALNLHVVSKLNDGAASAREQRAEQIKLSKRIIECTTRPDLRTPPVKLADLPKGDCYRQQQASAADFASPQGPFGQLIITSAACGAANPGDDKATLACVVKALKQ